MATFVLNRNFMIRSMTGHTVHFERGKETYVPDAMIKEVVAIGAERVDKKQEALVTDESDLPPPMSAEEQDEKILEALDTMFTRNVRGDFTGAGYPVPKIITNLVGFEVDTRTRDRLWTKFQEDRLSQ